MKAVRVASFFAGAGGLDLGFHQAGFDVVYASDIDKDCCKTLHLNKGVSSSKQSSVHCGDIRTIDFEELPRDIDLVLGGPPCQSFSASGRRAGGAAGRLDDRGNLFEAYRDIISHLQPSAFVFENVRGILATNKGEDWREIVGAFNNLGYRLDFRLLDAADYGIPQHRERMFLVGHRSVNAFLFPRPVYGPDSPRRIPHISPREAFKDLRVTNFEAGTLKFEGGKYSHLLADVPEGQNYLFFTAKRGHPSPIFAYRSRFSDFLYKAHPDYPMKTVIASPGKYTGPLHWENRYFSLDEYKAIQGFPRNYKFHGERASVVKQIGNSVSPKVAYFLAQAVAQQVFDEKKKIELLDIDENLTFDKRKGAKAVLTRKMHSEVKLSQRINSIISKKQSTFEFSLGPRANSFSGLNVIGSANKNLHHLDVYYDRESAPSANVRIEFWSTPRDFSGPSTGALDLTLYGLGLNAPQLLWNAVDEWVRMVTSFGSLFELYGHFTEPYPLFKVAKFDLQESDPVLEFAKFVSDFDRCSRYLDKNDLMSELAHVFDVNTFDGLATKLRLMRYDVRTRETNIAIPDGKYMIAYPFTLPQSKQMNFSVKQPRTTRLSDSYVTEKRVGN